MKTLRRVLKISISIFLMQAIYCYSYFSGAVDEMLLVALASTGGYLLGISLGLGPAVRHFKLSGKYLRYRRWFGIAGFLVSLGYTSTLLAISPAADFNNFPLVLITVPNVLGIFSMLVLAVMTLLSNQLSRTLLGVRCWKIIMRLGYAAYFSLVLRAVLMEGEVWLFWVESPLGLPPPRLLLSVFAMFVIISGLAKHVEINHRIPISLFRLSP